MVLVVAAARARGRDRRDVVVGRVEAETRLAMPDPVHGKIGGQHERREARLERLGDHLVRDFPIAEHVDLQPARALGRGRRHVDRRRGRDRREAHQRARRGRPARHAELVVLVRDRLVRHRRDEGRHRDRRPENGRLGRDRGHVDENPRPEAVARERLPVPAQRPLFSSTSGDVAPGARVDGLLGQPLGVVQSQELTVHVHAAERSPSAEGVEAVRRGMRRGSRRPPRTRDRTRGSPPRGPG